MSKIVHAIAQREHLSLNFKNSALKNVALFPYLEFKYRNSSTIWWLGSVAGPVIEANARPEFEDGLRIRDSFLEVAGSYSVRTQ